MRIKYKISEDTGNELLSVTEAIDVWFKIITGPLVDDPLFHMYFCDDDDESYFKSTSVLIQDEVNEISDKLLKDGFIDMGENFFELIDWDEETDEE